MTGAPKALSPAERAARVVLGQSGAKVRAEIEAAIAAAVAEEAARWAAAARRHLAGHADLHGLLGSPAPAAQEQEADHG